MDSKAGVDSRTVDFFTLDIEPPHRRPHSLGANSNHADVLSELVALSLQVTQQEAMGEPKDCPRLHGSENGRVVVCLVEK